MRAFLRHIISKTTLNLTAKNFIRSCSIDSEIKQNLIVEKFNAVTTLNINRPTSRNSLDEATLNEISKAIENFDKDNEAKVLIFHGEGGTFCSGFDIDDIEKKGYNTLTDAAHRLLRRPLCDKPTIAAVDGYAVAEGFELALACDMRIIEDKAIMGCLGRRFGVPQGLYGARRLTSLIGLSQALDLIMTGRLITGVEANSKGLAAKLTATGTALGEALKLAKSLVKFPQNALIMDKLAAIKSQLDESSEERMRDEAIISSLAGNAIADLAEGLKKFQYQGIGRHGKFYKLTDYPLKSWEKEDCEEEDKKEKKDN